MSKAKRPSPMQLIAKSFHFTKQDLQLNRQGKLSESQVKRQWRRFWGAIAILTIMLLGGGAILGVFVWGTAPDGTFTFLPSNAEVSGAGGDPQLFFFGQILGLGYFVILIFAFLGMVGVATRINRRELHTYRGMIELTEGFEDYYLKLLDDGRNLEIDMDQYKLLKPLADRRPFAVYYLKTRDGVISLEPI